MFCCGREVKWFVLLPFFSVTIAVYRPFSTINLAMLLIEGHFVFVHVDLKSICDLYDVGGKRAQFI